MSKKVMGDNYLVEPARPSATAKVTAASKSAVLTGLVRHVTM
jgi:hypothetical protein